jgi:hypothetical protein
MRHKQLKINRQCFLCSRTAAFLSSSAPPINAVWLSRLLGDVTSQGLHPHVPTPKGAFTEARVGHRHGTPPSQASTHARTHARKHAPTHPRTHAPTHPRISQVWALMAITWWLRCCEVENAATTTSGTRACGIREQAAWHTQASWRTLKGVCSAGLQCIQ